MTALGRGFARLDIGTLEGLFDASDYVRDAGRLVSRCRMVRGEACKASDANSDMPPLGSK